MSELTAGTLLQGGKYKIEKSLGQGGFGITYLAEQTNLGRRVCIKEFFMKEYGDRVASEDTLATVLTSVAPITSTAAQVLGRYREKFIKEAKTIAKLNHPGIVRIHDVFEENETAYYVMDYIEGVNLNDLVKKEGPLPEDRALGYIRQVADALSYIHGRNIMHLDVKPSNILVDSFDDKTVLIDFGTAKQYDSEGTQTSTTPTGMSAGYAPLELMKVGGVKTFSPEMDVYSLGATLYYLISGQNPPDASERMEMLMEGELLDYPKTVSAAVTDIIEKTLQPRKKRPQTVKEFVGLIVSLSPGRSTSDIRKPGKKEEDVPLPPLVPDGASARDPFYLPYLDDTGCLKESLTTKEAEGLHSRLEKASAGGDDYATLLLAAMKFRMSQKEDAIRMITPLERSADMKIAIRAMLDHISYSDSVDLREHLYDSVTMMTKDPARLEEARLYLAMSITEDGITEKEKARFKKMLEKLADSSTESVAQAARSLLAANAVGELDFDQAKEWASGCVGDRKRLSDIIIGFIQYHSSEVEKEKERAGKKVFSEIRYLEDIFGNVYGFAFGWAGIIAADMGKPKVAVKYFSLGAEKNDGTSMARLGRMLIEGGEGVTRNVDEALRWLSKANEAGEDVEQDLKIAESIKRDRLYIGFGNHQFVGENQDINMYGQIIVSDFSKIKDDDMVYLCVFNNQGKAVKFAGNPNFYVISWNLNEIPQVLFSPVTCAINFSETNLKDYSDGRIDVEFRLYKGRKTVLNALKFNLIGFYTIPKDWELLTSFPVSIIHVRHLMKKDEWYINNE